MQKEKYFGFLNSKIIFLFVFFIFTLHCLYYYPFFSDDSFISLRYCQRFIEGKGLTWNDGEKVEGYSNFLWVILISFFGFFFKNLVVVARILGYFLGVSTLLLIYNYFKRYKLESISVGLLFLILSASFSVWTIAGLEQPLVIFLITLIVFNSFKILDGDYKKSWLLLTLGCGLLSITRPDGIIFTLLIGTFFFTTNFLEKTSKNKIFTKKIFLFVFGSFSFYLALLAFRIYYYGEFFPNTALAKVSFSVHHVFLGTKYFLEFLINTFPFNIISGFFLLKLAIKERDKKAFFLLFLSSVWILYIIIIGGDYFPAFRMFEIIILLICLGLIYGIEKTDFSKILVKHRNLITFFSFIIFIAMQFCLKYNYAAKEERWEFKNSEIGKILKNSFPENSEVAVTAAGSIPFASEMKSIDMLGLNDYYLPRNQPKNFGNGPIGHELGDSNYILNIRKPDIIIFNNGTDEPSFPFAKKMLNEKKFKEDYVKACFLEDKISKQEVVIFINKYGKNAGVRYDEDKITIPHYLLSSANKMSVQNQNLKTFLLKPETITIKNPKSKSWQINENENFKGFITNKGKLLEISIFPKNRFRLKEVILTTKN